MLEKNVKYPYKIHFLANPCFDIASESTNACLLAFVSRSVIEKMANRTVKDAHSIKGTNPQHLVEKIIRTRIYECRYWKEDCFALTGITYLSRDSYCTCMMFRTNVSDSVNHYITIDLDIVLLSCVYAYLR